MRPRQIVGLGIGVLDHEAVERAAAVRGAILLGRQGVEAAIAEVWRERGVKMDDDGDRPTLRDQLLCLEDLDPRLARRVRHVWWQLTRGCHHQVYELAPTRHEAREMLQETLAAVDGLGEVA